jgi:iron complex outermembrane receptor protein
MSPIRRHHYTGVLSFVGICVSFALLTSAAPAAGREETPGAAEEEDSREAIVITETRTSDDAYFEIDPRREANAAVDSAALLKRIPGADVSDNGPLSGQVQYRGMFGSRMNVRVDGVFIDPGGPNWMDTPLHYAPRPLLRSLEVERGIASLSSGAETLGGAVRATLKRSAFSEDEAFRFHTDLEATGRSANQSFAGGGVISLANRRHRLHVLGSAEVGDDVDTPEGEIRASQHERYTYGGGYGIRLGQHELGVDYRRNETGETGNPALPMDIIFVDTDLVRGSYTGGWSGVGLKASLDYSDVDHEMDNFSVRPPPTGSMPSRLARASGSNLGYGAAADFAVWGGALSAGVDGNLTRHDMQVFDPDDALFFVDNFNDVRRDRHGAFAEWRGSPFDRWQLELGVRYTRIESDADVVDALPAQSPGPVRDLRDAFNAAERRQSDDLFDWLVRLAFSPRDSFRAELAIARKMRAPYYVERYAWLPLEVTAGLADGHNYVGDIELDPELSREVEGGVRWRGRWISLAPRAFYRRVDDYIQGVKIAPPQNDPLRFSNVDAVFYGVDVEYSLPLPRDFGLDGVLSYVRGERRDVDDALYRIAPLRGRTALRYRRGGWSAGIEGVYAARQQNVSAENDEIETPGYGIMHLFFHWEPGAGIGISAGVDNVLDAFYQDHLYGTNRVRDSAVAVNERLPGSGRSFFGSISWRW